MLHNIGKKVLRMKAFKQISVVFLLSVFSLLAHSVENTELCQATNDSCTFVLLSEEGKGKVLTSKTTTINENRANEAMSPFSTFKVVNSVIGLDLGLIKDAKQPLTFDKEAYPVQAWWPHVWKLPSYNLTTAFKYSMVAIYRQLAKDIGETNMRAYLKKMQYGNEDISSGLDSFWLNGSMKISAVEQVQLLSKIYHNQMKLSDRALNTLKEVMLLETNADYRIYAKTGAGKVDNGTMLGWYIGFVENAAGVHFFALNFDSPTYAAMKSKRSILMKNHLRSAGIIK